MGHFCWDGGNIWKAQLDDQDSLGYYLLEELKYCDELYDCNSDYNSREENENPQP
jgi:hypothetical protein